MMRAVGLLLLLCALPTLAEKPKLVVLITVDQLRGDHPTRLEDRLGDGGLKWLMNQGTYYTAAHYRHASTVTAVGHATIATGANAPEHGIVENRWYSRDTGAMVYCVEDHEHQLLGIPGKPETGTSPKNLLVSTIGDEMVIASGGHARVFGVSLKDRAAMLLAGKLGKALWFHAGTGRFITSDYYYREYPSWVNTWNDAKPVEPYRSASWTLLKPLDTYAMRDQDDRAVEAYVKFGHTFPHDLSQVPEPFKNSALSATPFGDRLTLDFAKALLANERLGQSGTTDLLCISLTATDVIGHVFGPTSLEMEDAILQLDAALAEFFSYLDGQLGLQHCLVVLSADHGGHEVAEHTAALGFPGNRIERETLIPAANAALKEKFGVDALVLGIEDPHVFLNVPAIRTAKLDEATVNDTLAAWLREQPGILYAYTREQLLEGRVADAPAARRLSRSFHPLRGGNVLIAPLPYWYFYNGDQGGTHSGPWAYDTFVPVMFAGAGVPAARIATEAGPEDIAPTIANLLGILPPSGSVGKVLHEAWPVKVAPAP